MAATQRVGDLEVAQDLGFERRQWTVQRYAWIVVAVIVLGGLLGLFGPGLLSSASVGEKGTALWMEYHRFLRFQGPTTLRVHLGLGAAESGELRLELDKDYVRAVKVENVTPPPERVEVGAARHTYAFRAGDLPGPTVVTFYLIPERAGTLKGRVGLPAGTTHEFTQFVYP